MKILAAILFAIVLSVPTSALGQESSDARAFVSPDGTQVMSVSVVTLDANATAILQVDEAPQAFFQGANITRYVETRSATQIGDYTRYFNVIIPVENQSMPATVIFVADGTNTYIAIYITSTPEKGFETATDYLAQMVIAHGFTDPPEGWQEV